jgi:K+-sensing histidine kinase KdpD
VLAAAARAAADLFPQSLAVAAAPDAESGGWRLQTAGSSAAAPPSIMAALRRLLPGAGRTAGGRAARQAGAGPGAGRAPSLHESGLQPAAVLETALQPAGETPGLLGVIRRRGPTPSDHERQVLASIAAQTDLALLAVQADGQLRACLSRQREHDEFFSLLAHDIRTPLTAIRGYAQLLLRYGAAGPDSVLRSGLSTIVQQTDRLTALTDILLDVARIRMGRVALRRTAVDLGQLAREAAQSLQAQPGAPPATVDAPDTGPVVEADLTRLEQITRGLLAFATERSGADTQHTLRLRVAADQDGASLSVDDAGPVLPPVERARLYEQLVVFSEDQRSPSLGRVDLYVIRGLTEAHGGRVSVESPVPGQDGGARLRVWLPLHVH